METLYLFPGSFDPPTKGHFHLVKKVLNFLPHLTIVCSENNNKNNNWFSKEESKKLWQSYKLPDNVNIVTIDELKNTVKNYKDIVMIRGIRNSDDAKYEKQILINNNRDYHIEQFFYIYSDPAYQNISSSAVRRSAENLILEDLFEMVSPMVISALLEKTLNIHNLFLVVGRPGSGKSTFLKEMEKLDEKNIFINTDNFNHFFKNILQKEFPGKNIIDMALKDEKNLIDKIKKPWMDLLKTSLLNARGKHNVFVEIAYGLEKEKSMFRFIGGKVVCINCSKKEQIKRVKTRGTPELLPFIEKIPDIKETRRIAKENNLELRVINTGCSLIKLYEKIKCFSENIQSEIKK